MDKPFHYQPGQTCNTFTLNCSSLYDSDTQMPLRNHFGNIKPVFFLNSLFQWRDGMAAPKMNKTGLTHTTALMPMHKIPTVRSGISCGNEAFTQHTEHYPVKWSKPKLAVTQNLRIRSGDGIMATSQCGPPLDWDWEKPDFLLCKCDDD